MEKKAIMGKRYYLFVYCITGKVVLNTGDMFEIDESSIEKLINKLAQYKIFNKINLMELDETFHKGLNELKIYSILNRKTVLFKNTVSKSVREYIYNLSSLIAKRLYFDICLANDIVTDNTHEIINKITNKCIENYCKSNILKDNEIKFIYNPEKVNEVISDLNVFKNTNFWDDI